MALSAQRISAPTSGFAATANTRLGDGIRASSSTSAFMPVPATEAMPEILLQDQGLRNDDWARRDEKALKAKDESPSGGGRVYFRTVFMSNADARTLFNARFDYEEDGVQTPANENVRGARWFERATGTYEANNRLLAAAYRGLSTLGSSLNRLL